MVCVKFETAQIMNFSFEQVRIEHNICRSWKSKQFYYYKTCTRTKKNTRQFKINTFFTQLKILN